MAEGSAQSLDLFRREFASAAAAVLAEARAIRIEDEDGKKAANEFYLKCVQLRKKIGAFFSPHVEAAKAAKKAADDARAGLVRDQERMEEPVREAERIVGKEVQAYLDSQAEIERVRREEEERKNRPAREEAALQAAVQAEELGLKGVADRILEEEVAAPVPVAPAAPPKLQGMAQVETWDFELTDLRALAKAVVEGVVPLEALQVNDVYVRRMVRDVFKDKCTWPGIRPTVRRAFRPTGR